jgi:hypothetical protein
MIANWQSEKRMKLEESGYSIEPEQVVHGIIRKETKLIECAQGKKKEWLNNVIGNIEESNKKNESKEFF